MRKKDRLSSSHLALFYPTPLKHTEVCERGEPCIPEAQLSTAGFPLCFLISSPQHPSAQCSLRKDPPRAPEQRTCGWGQGRPGTACWKSSARLLLGDDSLNFPSFRLLQAGITSGSPGTPCSLLPLLTALSLSWDNCPAAVSLQTTEWLGSPRLVAEGTAPAFAA